MCTQPAVLAPTPLQPSAGTPGVVHRWIYRVARILDGLSEQLEGPDVAGGQDGALLDLATTAAREWASLHALAGVIRDSELESDVHDAAGLALAVAALATLARTGSPALEEVAGVTQEKLVNGTMAVAYYFVRLARDHVEVAR